MIRTAYARTIDPTDEPLTIDELKLHIASTQPDEDRLIDSARMVAREAAESFLCRGLMTQTWVFKVSEWADVLHLPMAAPLQSVTSITYYDANNAQQTLSSSVYEVDTTSEPGRITLATGQSWPSIYSREWPIAITYVVGWTTAERVPELIKQGIRYHVAAADMDRVGGSADAEAGRRAAERSWTAAGVVYWREPETCHA